MAKVHYAWAVLAVLIVSHPQLSLYLLLYCYPQLLGLLRFGVSDAVPGPITPHLLFTNYHDQTRQVGQSRFASEAAYHRDYPLSEAQRAAYLRDGYLVLRGVIPRRTMSALQPKLYGQLGRAPLPYEWNAHLVSDELLDFYLFGPFGKIAAQLLGRDDVHLLHSVHMFRAPNILGRVRRYHYDDHECGGCAAGGGFPLANDPVGANVKFYVALYDCMPAMWFVNQSTFLAQVGEAVGFNASEMKDIGRWPSELFDEMSLKPLISLGDAIVHSTTIPHRSPLSTLRRPLGYLGPAYGASTGRFLGPPVPRVCDAGVHYLTRWADVPMVRDVPRPECFPRVHPPEAARRHRGEYRISYRRLLEEEGAETSSWYWMAWRMALQHAQRTAPLLAAPPPSPRVPAANTVTFGAIAGPFCGE